MVDKSSKVLVFDGVKPEAVVFGDSLGEGKTIQSLQRGLIVYLNRRVRQCQSGLVED